MRKLINELITQFCSELSLNSYTDRLQTYNAICWPETQELGASKKAKLESYYFDQMLPHKVAIYQLGMSLAPFFELPSAELTWQLMIHDQSKFSLAEAEYAFFNFKNYSENSVTQQQKFAMAWHHHKVNNPHHPEHWWQVEKDGSTKALAIPTRYIAEIVTDWVAAGKTYERTTREWLSETLPRFRFHTETALKLQEILRSVGIQVNVQRDLLILI
ncbi:hypothetical protein BKI52_05615 [marine bacterium AO1-C]|nr:hypothetical protein BKI52_05615 [marine bacterium AO1-C]